MIIKSLYFKNIRSFEEAEIKFVKSNFITGWNLDTEDGNGVGKSTIIASILLLLGGAKLVDINLKKFIRDGEKTALIVGVFEIGENTIEIERILKLRGTGNLRVFIDGKEENFKTSKVAQEKILEYIGSTDNFKKFRIIDSSTGINILDFTSGQLRKTLMGLCQDKFDKLRKKLLEKKNLYEKYNKSAVLNKHYPSMKRLQVLIASIKTFDTTEMNTVLKQIHEFQIDKNKLLMERGKYVQTRDIKTRQIQKLKNLGTCPSCFQKVSEEHKKSIIQPLNKDLKIVSEKIANILQDLKMYDEIIQTEEKKKIDLYAEKQKLTNLKYKLDTRIAQKEYKYTDEDVQLVKKAIEIIDEFANYYVIEWIKIIEPIVNSYIDCINMQMNFQVDENANIEIIVTRNEKQYTYDQLSQGEKIFLSTVFKIALLMEQQESGLMLADEAFNSLSGENLNRILEIISNLPVQLLCISHNPDINKSLAQEIFIEKANDVSIIKEEK